MKIPENPPEDGYYWIFDNGWSEIIQIKRVEYAGACGDRWKMVEILRFHEPFEHDYEQWDWCEVVKNYTDMSGPIVLEREIQHEDT